MEINEEMLKKASKQIANDPFYMALFLLIMGLFPEETYKRLDIISKEMEEQSNGRKSFDADDG